MTTGPRQGSAWWRILRDQGLVLLALGLVAAGMLARRATPTARETVAVAPTTPIRADSPDPTVPVEPIPAPAPLPAAEPKPAVAEETLRRVESDLGRVAREREALQGRIEEESRRIAQEKARLAGEVRRIREREAGMGNSVGRLDSIRRNGQVLMARIDGLKAELKSLADAPRPRRKALIDQTPVARSIEGSEFHFELRKGRIAYIDLERLVERVKTDARMQLRVATTGGRMPSKPIVSTVGPVGAFSMSYELGVTLPTSLSAMIQGGTVNVGLNGWEIVPEREVRGQAFEDLMQPGSEFSRVLNSLDPEHSTVTLWIYPDSFALYRRVGELLHRRGFIVAARPLPEGMPIRGSPNGSLSAGQ